MKMKKLNLLEMNTEQKLKVGHARMARLVAMNAPKVILGNQQSYLDYLQKKLEGERLVLLLRNILGN